MITKSIISYSDFDKLDFRIGTITHAEVVPDSKKLLRLEVDFGEFKRQILGGLAKSYQPEDLINIQALFLVNLEPRTLAGLESQGMLIAAGALDTLPVVLRPDKELPSGTEVH